MNKVYIHNTDLGISSDSEDSFWTNVILLLRPKREGYVNFFHTFSPPRGNPVILQTFQVGFVNCGVMGYKIL